jgi:hypothetical protein
MDNSVRAERAKQILDDPLVKEAFESVEAAIILAMKRSEVGDTSTHHNLTLSLQLLEQVHRQFTKWIIDGKVESFKSTQRN